MKALDQYNIVTVTNADEHKYLDDYLDSSVIGTKALSSVLVEKEIREKALMLQRKILLTVQQVCMKMRLQQQV